MHCAVSEYMLFSIGYLLAFVGNEIVSIVFFNAIMSFKHLCICIVNAGLLWRQCLVIGS